MRTAKVKALCISGKNKHLYRSGNTVKENNFPDGQFDKYLKGGYIELLNPPTVKEVEAELDKANSKKEVDAVVAGDKREGVIKAAEKRILSIREAAEKAAKKATADREAKLNADRIEKISNASTVEEVKSIQGNSEDEKVLKAAEEKSKELQSAADEAAKIAQEKAEKEAAAQNKANALEKIPSAETIEVVNELAGKSEDEEIMEAASARISELEAAAESEMLEQIKKATTIPQIEKLIEGVESEKVLKAGNDKITALKSKGK